MTKEEFVKNNRGINDHQARACREQGNVLDSRVGKPGLLLRDLI